MKKMARILFVSLVLILSGVVLAPAQHLRGDEQLGIGIILGKPAAGLSVEYWLGEGMSVDGALAWSFVGNTGIYVHGDLLYHFMVQRLDAGPTLAPYVGPGIALTLADDLVLAARVPIGVNLLFNEVPIGVFAEVVPVFTLLPGSGFDVDAAIGARFYF